MWRACFRKRKAGGLTRSCTFEIGTSCGDLGTINERALLFQNRLRKALKLESAINSC
jgi:hypothetical protein